MDFFFSFSRLFFFFSRVRVRKTVRHERNDVLWFSFSTYIPVSVCNITQYSEAIQIVLLLAESDCVHSNVVIRFGFERSSQIHSLFPLLCCVLLVICFVGDQLGLYNRSATLLSSHRRNTQVSKLSALSRVHAPHESPELGSRWRVLHTGITQCACGTL